MPNPLQPDPSQPTQSQLAASKPTQVISGAHTSAGRDHPLVRRTLIGLTLLVVGVLIIIPVINIFVHALGGGLWAYISNLVSDRDTRHSILMTLTVAPISVAVNTVFGVAAAWAIARFRFPGRTLLTTLIDLPFSISPVVAGLMIVLIFGLQGHLGPWLREHNIKILFAVPGLILATTFVTLPFVARELLPVMEAIGAEEEIAAVSLGASAVQTFWHITLPNIKWGLLYGVVLCNARAMGEYGAVYVVAGHQAGRTYTMPLQVNKLFEDSHTAESFALASLLTLLAVVTLAAKVALERRTRRDLLAATRMVDVPETSDTSIGAAGPHTTLLRRTVVPSNDPASDSKSRKMVGAGL
jgi:sulfate transport system permease protein